MDDTWTPSPTAAEMYWSVDECCWVAAPVKVTIPGQREDEPAAAPASA